MGGRHQGGGFQVCRLREEAAGLGGERAASRARRRGGCESRGRGRGAAPRERASARGAGGSRGATRGGGGGGGDGRIRQKAKGAVRHRPGGEEDSRLGVAAAVGNGVGLGRGGRHDPGEPPTDGQREEGEEGSGQEEVAEEEGSRRRGRGEAVDPRRGPAPVRHRSRVWQQLGAHHGRLRRVRPVQRGVPPRRAVQVEVSTPHAIRRGRGRSERSRRAQPQQRVRAAGHGARAARGGQHRQVPLRPRRAGAGEAV